MAGIIEVKDQGKLRIYDADNSHYIDIVVPSSVTANRTITIPDASFTVPQADTNTVYTHPNHSGEVTSSADGATVIADNIVDEANLKISNSAVNGYMLTAQSGNTGGLTWAAAPAGITESDQWRITADKGVTSTANVFDANLERVDSTGQGYIGNGMSVSSGKWTFPSTGIWLVIASVNFENSSNNNARYIVVEQEFTNNNGTSYNVSSISLAYFNSLSSPITTNSVSHNIIDITNTSNDKMRFKVSAAEACIARGNSGFNETSFTFIRLGDT